MTSGKQSKRTRRQQTPSKIDPSTNQRETAILLVTGILVLVASTYVATRLPSSVPSIDVDASIPGAEDLIEVTGSAAPSRGLFPVLLAIIGGLGAEACDRAAERLSSWVVDCVFIGVAAILTCLSRSQRMQVSSLHGWVESPASIVTFSLACFVWTTVVVRMFGRWRDRTCQRQPSRRTTFNGR